MKFEDYQFEWSNESVDEENFDIEKWRYENPVDYLRALHLINMYPDRNIAFETIYRVMRLYIPDTLYKYYSLTDDAELNKKKFETLQNNKIFTCEAKYLNDPFDNKAYYYNHNKLKKYDVFKKYDGRLIDDFSSYNQVTALTSNKVNSMPMWAHYSNNHQGFCISYEMSNDKNLELCSCTYPVQYTEQRIDITSLMIDQMDYILNEIDKQSSIGKKEVELNDFSLIFLISLFTNIKHSSWSYENEFRCSIGIGSKVSPYVTAYPKEIYVGMNCLQENKELLIKIGNQLNIPVYEMIYDELMFDFNLVAKLI